MSATDGQVLIIGAGLGGLALAQILQVKNIPFRIFERDEEFDTRAQGWAVALSALVKNPSSLAMIDPIFTDLLGSCLDTLIKLLPESAGDIYSTSVNANVGELDAAAVVDAFTGARVAKIGGVPRGQPGHMLRCRREKLREFLAQNIPISTGKQFSHYIEDEQGVIAFFEDGTSARGSILVGSDGASSKVRSQLLSSSATLAPYIPIMGRVRLPRWKYQHLRDINNAGVITGKKDLRYLVALLSIEPDRSFAEYYYAVCYQPPDPNAEATWSQSACRHDLHAQAVKQTQDLPDFLTEIIRYSGPDAIIVPTLTFREFVPPDFLPVGRVTLIGDAAHAMMPFQGAGANTALLDACDLASLLMANPDKIETKDGVVSLLQEYSNIVCPRGKENVTKSHASGETMNKILGSIKLPAAQPLPTPQLVAV